MSDYEWQARMVRIYIAQARVTKSRSWKLTLLEYAAGRRRRAIQSLKSSVLDAGNQYRLF